MTHSKCKILEVIWSAFERQMMKLQWHSEFFAFVCVFLCSITKPCHIMCWLTLYIRVLRKFISAARWRVAQKRFLWIRMKTLNICRYRIIRRMNRLQENNLMAIIAMKMSSNVFVDKIASSDNTFNNRQTIDFDSHRYSLFRSYSESAIY